MKDSLFIYESITYSQSSVFRIRDNRSLRTKAGLNVGLEPINNLQSSCVDSLGVSAPELGGGETSRPVLRHAIPDDFLNNILDDFDRRSRKVKRTKIGGQTYL
jgi:hypothetical protein